jgi:hypothetical protein
MSGDRLARVFLSGDREGAYLVAEERGDGSLVLVPDTSRNARRQRERAVGSDAGALGQLLRRRSEPVRTTNEALDSWGVELEDSEFVVEFTMADVDERPGFIALTNRRLIFLARGRKALELRDEHPLSGLTSVERVGRGRKPRLVVGWEGSARMSIESPDRAQLERLEAALLAR